MFSRGTTKRERTTGNMDDTQNKAKKKPKKK